MLYYVEGGGEGGDLHDVLLLVLDHGVHRELGRLQSNSELQNAAPKPPRYLIRICELPLCIDQVGALGAVALLAVVIQFVARHLTPQVRHLRQVLLLKHDGGSGQRC